MYQILDNNFNLKDAALMPDEKYSLEMETSAIQSAIEDNISRFVANAHGKSIEGCTWKLRPTIGLFYIYGRIVVKQKKDCSSYYKSINENRTNIDFWLNL